MKLSSYNTLYKLSFISLIHSQIYLTDTWQKKLPLVLKKLIVPLKNIHSHNTRIKNFVYEGGGRLLQSNVSKGCNSLPWNIILRGNHGELKNQFHNFELSSYVQKVSLTFLKYVLISLFLSFTFLIYTLLVRKYCVFFPVDVLGHILEFSFHSCYCCIIWHHG